MAEGRASAVEQGVARKGDGGAAWRDEPDTKLRTLVSAHLPPLVPRTTALLITTETTTPVAVTEAEAEERELADEQDRGEQLRTPGAPRLPRGTAGLRLQRTSLPELVGAMVTPDREDRGGLLVDDDVQTLTTGQMRKAELMRGLRAEVCRVAREELARVGRSAEGCPYIDQMLGYYEARPAAHVERALRRYAPEARNARSAAEYLPHLSARLGRGIARWVETGRMPEDVPDEVRPSMAGATGLVGIAAGLLGLAPRRKADGPDPGHVDGDALVGRLGPGRPLDNGVRSRMESALGHSFAAVRVHADDDAAALSRDLHARAFTVGTHVAFGAGELRPGTPDGDALLAHELAHVMQQGTAAPHGDIPLGAAGDTLEHDADDAAHAAMVALYAPVHARDAGLESPRGRHAGRRRGEMSLQRCGPDPDYRALYRTAFNAMWPSRTEATTFDASLPSGGPRTPRSRAIFTEIMRTTSNLRSAYERNTGGLRDYADVFEYPDPPPAPPAAPPLPPPPPGEPPPPSGPLAPFLSGVTFTGGSATISTNNRIRWTMRTSLATGNPGPDLARRVQLTTHENEVDPPEERWSEVPWPAGATEGPPHEAHVQPVTPAGTDFEAALSFPTESSFTPRRATVSVTDERAEWFRTHIVRGIQYVQGSDTRWFAHGTTTPITYYSGQIGIATVTSLSGANPRLPVFVAATMTRNGTTISGLPADTPQTRVGFAESARFLNVGTVLLNESSPPPTTPDTVEITLRYYMGRDAATTFHTITETVQIAASPVIAPDAAATTLAADTTWLRDTLVPHMQRAGAPPHQTGIAALLTASPPRLFLKAMVVRPDSARQVVVMRGDPSRHAAWYVGSTANTILLAPNAWGVHSPSTAHDTVFLCRTTNLATGNRRGDTAGELDGLADLAAHEAIHAADTHLGYSAWDQYKREFRAYWIAGMASTLPTDQMSTAPPIGPRSARANAIFRHLYGNPLYDYVQENYDPNRDGFRDKANAMFHPDGVNLTLTVALFDLQREVESGPGTDFAAKRTAVSVKYTLCSDADKIEVHTQNQWRVLVERAFPDAGQRRQIYDALEIP